MALHRKPRSEDGSTHPNLDELGAHLRRHRELVSPERAGFAATSRRKTPGLRREEVAELAGISESWYTRLELGTAGVPSGATIYAISRALQLGPPDVRYLYELSGLQWPTAPRRDEADLSLAVNHVALNLKDAATTVFDWYCTPYCWNAVADGMFRWSAREDPFERNMIVSGLTDPYYRVLCGSDEEFDKVSRGVIGAFRRRFMTSEPTPLARRIFDFGMNDAFFRTIWNEVNVAEAFTEPGPVVRHVPGVGALKFDFSDLIPAGQSEILIRVLSPHDDDTRRMLPRLEAMGTARLLLP